MMVVQMKMLRATYAISLGLDLGLGLGICGTMLVAKAAAQIALPAPKPLDGAALFSQQCGTCHTTNLSDPVRQGPSLFMVVGRRAGTAEGFPYSAGFTKADFAWDDARLDAWITNPQAMIPGAVMAYRQAKPEIRATIIAYLKELK
jgi:cytochrome c